MLRVRFSQHLYPAKLSLFYRIVNCGVHSIHRIFSLSELGLITIPNTPMPLLATVLGGFVFGIGMILANCCASGGWFRTEFLPNTGTLLLPPCVSVCSACWRGL
ncbi:YeeE/YedE thiosulfate transporter family protein [Glaesserella parasuis]|nr:YeeE/YedE thiosulfate transporter family protein [Glaesserella parasuis]MDG6265041.1 YeeE/YedE thiosulfate transporter family protein [Glaesserella parasuis]MDG6296500.1 YeeE/YedE thiosulfate transporter family protein [Glaesserella parasuis]MDG6320336.1 YeeE/YedE thiosulfate transporter family protein [Glaesserella parasuis]MDP0270261.1 YeeE/YedE thiosulfate transporter family protein [Glaesserella parasuis]MDP0283244.1 YeeE/YedE thiosulfate transporter family protein [Glaesserella parasui